MYFAFVSAFAGTPIWFGRLRTQGILPTLLVRTKWLQELACPATRYFWGLSWAESGMMIKLASTAVQARGLSAVDRSWSLSARIFYCPFGDGNSTDGGQNIFSPTRSSS